MANHAGPPMPPLGKSSAPTPLAMLPSLATLASFIQGFFPVRTGDVNFLYHAPRPLVDPATTSVRRVVLSVTPTPGVYAALSPSLRSDVGCSLAFLHRPWQLDRRKVPRGVTVLSCHKGFDEVLTVGANFALAQRLGMVLGKVDQGEGVVQGYKGDPDRRIGIVAGVRGSVGWEEMKARVLREFGSEDEVEGCFGFDGENQSGGEESWEAEGGGVKVELNGHSEGEEMGCRGVAIMNAFHPEEVDRVKAMAQEQGIVSDADDCSQLFYLTGAVREPGLVYAREKRMKVICVGHRVCELWGITYLAQRIREEYPAVEVIKVDEEEEPPPSKKSSPSVKEAVSDDGTGTVLDSTKKAKP